MTFDALIEHYENDDDAVDYVVEATSLADAKIKLREMVVGRYHLYDLIETKASFDARRAA